MLRLNLSKEPRWIELLEGVRVRVLPVTSALMASVRPDIPEDMAATGTNDELAVAFYKLVARRVILEWEGIEGEDGKPARVTPEGVDALLDVYLIYEAWAEKVMAPFIGLESEKNGSALSLNGTSAGATATARPVRAVAKSARPASTRRKR